MTRPLILKRASASRPSVEWDDDDFDVLEDGVVVGRIFTSLVAPGCAVALEYRLRPPSRPHTKAWQGGDA
jgi:hypothetical protein